MPRRCPTAASRCRSRLNHVDIKKLGNTPDGGGWRVHGRRMGNRNSQHHPSSARNRHGSHYELGVDVPPALRLAAAFTEPAHAV